MFGQGGDQRGGLVLQGLSGRKRAACRRAVAGHEPLVLQRRVYGAVGHGAQSLTGGEPGVQGRAGGIGELNVLHHRVDGLVPFPGAAGDPYRGQVGREVGNAEAPELAGILPAQVGVVRQYATRRGSSSVLPPQARVVRGS